MRCFVWKCAILLLLCKTTNHVLQLEYPVASNGARDVSVYTSQKMQRKLRRLYIKQIIYFQHYLGVLWLRPSPFCLRFWFSGIQFQKMHNWPALSSMVIPWISVLLGCLFRTELKSFDMTLNNSQNRYNLKCPGQSECAVFRDVWKKPWVWRVLFMITMRVHFHVHIKVLNMLYDRARFCDLKRNGILERIW